MSALLLLCSSIEDPTLSTHLSRERMRAHEGVLSDIPALSLSQSGLLRPDPLPDALGNCFNSQSLICCG